jgi:hypothetical protein
MAESFSGKKHQANPRRWLITAFLIYGTMLVGLVGYFAIFLDATHELQAEKALAATATKPVRYEAVIANWNRYRNKDARADAQ